MNDSDRFEFGKELKKLRERGDLGQRDIARSLQISPPTIHRWERGEVPPRSIHVRQLIETFLSNESFTKGRELEEAKRFWKLGVDDEVFNEDWFKARLRKKEASSSITVFCCYAREDKQFMEELQKHLAILRKHGHIATWFSQEIVVGQNRDRTFDSYMAKASIILLLISPDLLVSDYVSSDEMVHAIERSKRDEVQIIPIIIRPARWDFPPLDMLLALPRDGGAVSQWKNRDDAFYTISKELQLIIENMRQRRIVQADYLRPEQISEMYRPIPGKTLPLRTKRYPLYEVFKKSGVPEVTFVKRKDFERLKLSLAQPGRGVVIEGPSGIGKTTSVQKAVKALQSRQSRSNVNTKMQILTAREPEHRSQLQTLPQWHAGTVIIDDFHRLNPQQQGELIDYLKYLADTEPASKKLVIVGIPRTGQMLVDVSFDLATRIDVFKLGRVSDELLQHMIEKGEKALNIVFDRKADIVLAANGSLNVAQLLCFHLCEHQELIETQEQLQIVSCDIHASINDVLASLSLKFGKSVKHFAAMGGPRNSISLALLEELTGCDDGFLSLSHLKGTQPEKTGSIDRFLNEDWMGKLYSVYPDCANHLFFDRVAQALVIDDPQLAFYLKKISLTVLSREAGKSPALAQRKVFISYSRKDKKWLEQLRVQLKPLEREGFVELWDDTKIIAGAHWKETIQEALDTSRVAVTLVSAHFLASDFIAQHELPALLSHAASGGTVIIPIIISPCLFAQSGLSRFKAVNDPDKPLSAMKPSDRERILVSVAEVISKRLLVDEI